MSKSIEARMDALRTACRVNETGEHTCMSDPEVEAAYAAWVAEMSSDTQSTKPLDTQAITCDDM